MITPREINLISVAFFSYFLVLSGSIYVIYQKVGMIQIHFFSSEPQSLRDYIFYLVAPCHSNSMVFGNAVSIDLKAMESQKHGRH